MALNFGSFQTAQPVTAFFKGQEDVARDALAQENRMLAREKLSQEREVNALRRQQLMGEMQQQQQTQRKQARVEKTGLFRDRLLRAADSNAAREVVRMQYADPDVGPFLSQFSTLDQALAEVPEDPTRFEAYRQQEAMGMGEWIKSQAAERKTLDNQRRWEAYQASRRPGGGASLAPAVAQEPPAEAAPAAQPVDRPVAAESVFPRKDAVFSNPTRAVSEDEANSINRAINLYNRVSQLAAGETPSWWAGKEPLDANARQKELDRAESIRQSIETLYGIQLVRPYGTPSTAPRSPIIGTPPAPAAAPVAAPAGAANVLAAQQGAEPPPNVNQLAAGSNLQSLLSDYREVSEIDTPGARAEAALLLKQIDAAFKRNTLSDRFVPVGNLVFDRQTERFITPTEAQLAATRAQQQPGAPIAVIGPDGKPRYVTREQAIGLTPFTPAAVQVLGMGPGREPTAAARQPAGAAGAPQPRPLTAVQEAARRDKLGKEFKSATAALQTTQDVLDSISFVRAEPGLSRATGFTGTFLPSFPEGAAASAETRLKNLEGKVTALGKAQAAATGAIGSIANQEWQILRDQIAAIDRTKGTGPLLKQLELVELQAKGAMARIRDAYQRQFGEDFERFPQFSDLPPPQSSFRPSAAPGAAPGGGGVDSTNPLLR
jgi:hypothetical protein